MFEGKCSCIHCKEVKSVKGIHVHVDRTHLSSTKYSSGNNGKYNDPAYKEAISAGIKKAADERFGELVTRKEFCNKCGKEFEVSERTSSERKPKYFCSRSCANSHEVTDEHRRRTSEKLSGRVYSPPVEVSAICKCCLTEFIYTKYYTKREREFCSRSCIAKYSRKEANEESRKNRPALTNYRADAAFKFSLNDYPDMFDFSLVEQFGWYKAANRGNNLNGVSRDHMVSVRYGFDNNIPPELLGHPANCKLVRHSENSSKHLKCSMTAGELFARILMF